MNRKRRSKERPVSASTGFFPEMRVCRLFLHQLVFIYSIQKAPALTSRPLKNVSANHLGGRGSVPAVPLSLALKITPSLNTPHAQSFNR